ncbi:MAG: hypothetical protein H7301_06475 [Cryobacterium sp.]|nr:hypothetical protein [Oligoflexia bacterium]
MIFRTKKKLPQYALNEKGQVSIFIGSMLLTFFLLLAFVLNTGMLVNAKINLQNAADLAAYAGAGVQARQLNDIGYLNYEMRRTYKKFLFRYYVIGNSPLPSFPKGRGAPTSGVAQFRVTDILSQSEKNLGVPSTCITFLPNENYCQIANLPAIPRPSSSSINNLDAIMGALDAKLTEIEGIRKKGCIGIGQMNQMLMFYWLWNTDPSLDEVTAALASAGGDADYIARLRVLRSLASGLGLLPREIFLRKRIDSLNQYVNFKPQRQVDLRTTNALKAGSDWAMHERTIQAFLSAYHTLGEGTFNGEDIKMDEILPEGRDGANLLSLKNLTGEFDAFATDFSIDNASACSRYTANTPTAEDRTRGCVQCLVSYSQSQKTSGFKPVLGVAKDPSVLTYYAIKLQAKAQLLFSPYGDLTLTAYAAAQPFGSRIGPSAAEMTDAAFSSPAAPANGILTPCDLNTCVGQIPNLAMKEGEPASPAASNGWGQNDILYNLYQGAFGTGGPGAIQQVVGGNDLTRAYHIAMAPNPWEMGRYNIPNDSNADPFQEAFGASGVRAIWAPLFVGNSTAANSNPASEIIGYINQMASAYTTQTASAKGIFNAAAQAALTRQINVYVNTKLKVGQGEDGEGLNVVRILDPISTRVDLAGRRNPLAPGIPDSILMRDAKRLKTGWNNVLNKDYVAKGRTGYSVKYVPLNTLRSASGVTTNGRDGFTNTLPTSNGVGNDIVEMKH